MQHWRGGSKTKFYDTILFEETKEKKKKATVQKAKANLKISVSVSRVNASTSAVELAHCGGL